MAPPSSGPTQIPIVRVIVERAPRLGRAETEALDRGLVPIAGPDAVPATPEQLRDGFEYLFSIMRESRGWAILDRKIKNEVNYKLGTQHQARHTEAIGEFTALAQELGFTNEASLATLDGEALKKVQAAERKVIITTLDEPISLPSILRLIEYRLIGGNSADIAGLLTALLTVLQALCRTVAAIQRQQIAEGKFGMNEAVTNWNSISPSDQIVVKNQSLTECPTWVQLNFFVENLSPSLRVRIATGQAQAVRTGPSGSLNNLTPATRPPQPFTEAEHGLLAQLTTLEKMIILASDGQRVGGAVWLVLDKLVKDVEAECGSGSWDHIGMVNSQVYTYKVWKSLGMGLYPAEFDVKYATTEATAGSEPEH